MGFAEQPLASSCCSLMSLPMTNLPMSGTGMDMSSNGGPCLIPLMFSLYYSCL